jgi:hypothetical protein
MGQSRHATVKSIAKPFIALLATIGLTSPSRGQVMKVAPRTAAVDPAPLLTRVFPPAAALGKTTECVVEGLNLKDVDRWTISGEGAVVAEVVSKTATSVKLKIAVLENADPTFRDLRAISANGLSNDTPLRIDSLEEVTESEPNDEPDKAQSLAVGQAVSGTLRKEDLDYYRFSAKGGSRLQIEVEARRLGTPLSPVLTLSHSGGAAIAQARQSPGINRDCRLDFSIPSDGSYIVQVRDNTYLGAEGATYRLRLDPAPFATAVFPLGGRVGPRIFNIEPGPFVATVFPLDERMAQPLRITASGGTLAQPITKTVVLRTRDGETTAVGLFDGPTGRIALPYEVVASDAAEIEEEPLKANESSITTLQIGMIANGRLAAAGEVDRYKVSLRKGEPASFRVRAAALGSWLDSVLTVRDPSGAIVAENDDVGVPANGRPLGFNIIGVPPNPDSRIDFEPKSSGDYVLELYDRFGHGGPEYAYRLEATAGQPDFSIAILLGDPNLAGRLLNVNGVAPTRPPGALGVFNLKPGASVVINYVITPEGNTGPISVSAEGLPAGVTAEPMTIRPNGASGSNSQVRVTQTRGALVLKVAANAPEGLGEMRVVGVAKTASGREIRRLGSAAISINSVPIPGTAPVSRTVSSLSIRVLKVANPKVGLRGAATIESTAQNRRSGHSDDRRDGIGAGGLEFSAFGDSTDGVELFRRKIRRNSVEESRGQRRPSYWSALAALAGQVKRQFVPTSGQPAAFAVWALLRKVPTRC